MISKLPQVSMMKISEVTSYLKKHSLIILQTVSTCNLMRFVHIEETKPYEPNPIYYYDANELQKIINADFFREMECHVVTRTDEKRWFQIVFHDKMIKDETAMIEQFKKLQAGYANNAKELQERAVNEANAGEYATAERTNNYAHIYGIAARDLNTILTGVKLYE